MRGFEFDNGRQRDPQRLGKLREPDPYRLGSLPAGVSRVTVTVTGTVFEDGVVSGARVSSSYVDGAVLQCLRGMASSLRIEGGVPEAPRVVTATLEVQR